MRKTRKITSVVIGIALAAALSVTAFAAVYSSPAEAAADLTGMTVEEVVAIRQETGATYGEIAAEAGKLDEFREAVIEIRRGSVQNMVTNGKMAQERAGELEQCQLNCDGTGAAGIGPHNGNGLGTDNGTRLQAKDGTCGGTCTATGVCTGTGTGTGTQSRNGSRSGSSN